MKKIFIKTFGCQMNKNDSDIIAQLLRQNGNEITKNPDDADVYLINTCSVRAHAEQRALGYISAFKKWREAKDRVLGVVGCMAKRLGDEIITKFPFVDLVLGPDSFNEINNYINYIATNKTKIIETKLNDTTYCGIYHCPLSTSDFVSIMRGCNNFCSYCVVPYVRGRARSRPVEDIMTEVKNLVDGGVKDITLLGQNVNEYAYNGINFANLLKLVSEVPQLFRLRFLTSHPKDFDKIIIDVVKSHKNICEWFHLPLQSGSNRILKLMKRHYTKKDYIKLINNIKKRVPEATITTDVIVGFPTETEKEFSETLAVLDEIKFDDAYMYRYSLRPGTAASQYQSLSEEIIKDRLTRLIEFQNRIIIEKTEGLLGRSYEVLFEGKTKNGTRGKTRGNKGVIVEQKIAPGEVHQVLITEVRGKTPVGKIK